MKKTLVSILFIFTLSNASVLSDMADTMQAGSWAELTTVNFNSSLLWIVGGGGADCLFNYSDDLEWNPGTDEAYYIGGSHYGPGKFVAYSAATNAWRVVDTPGWLTSLGHGYDHNALDPIRQWFYHNPMSTRNTTHVWEIGRQAWRSDVAMPSTTCTWENLACCRGVCFFPDYDRGGLVYANGKMAQVYFFGTTSGRWRTPGASVSMAGYHNVAKYNPVQKVVYLGGGNNENGLHVMDSTGAIRAIAASPAAAIGIYSSMTTVDPVTGDLLVLDNTGFYSYHLPTDAWTTHSGSVPLWSHGNHDIIYTSVGSVTNHGVTLWCKYANSTGRIWLYKHADAPDGIERRAAVRNRGRLTASPNPFNPATRISSGNLADGSVTVYNVSGRAIARPVLRNGIADWNAGNRPPGIYTAEVRTNESVRRLKLVLMK